MRRLGFALLALSTICLGQNPQTAPPAQKPGSTIQARAVEHAHPNAGYKPNQRDMYCSGFITSAKVPDGRYIVAGRDSYEQDGYAEPTARIFIKGTGFNVGDRFEIVRPVRNLSESRPYTGYSSLVRQTGQVYSEMGIVKVLEVQKNIAIVQPELACGEMKPGDVAMAFEEREAPAYHKVNLELFTPPNGKVTGRIVTGFEFETVYGAKSKVYLSIGSDKGLKVGDYLRAVRNYDFKHRDADMGLSDKASIKDDNQHGGPKVSKAVYNELPRATLGDMVVLHVHPHSATAMVVTSLEDIHAGDHVELMDVADAPVIVAPTSTVTTEQPIGAALPNPPTIACTASPMTVRAGETTVITCDAASPDNRPLTVRFSANNGKITSSNNRATLDTADTGSGPITVRAVAYDDRNLTAAASTTVNVDPPVSKGPPTAKKLNELQFKVNSSYVDNRAKAILDDVALNMQQDATSTLQLSGSSEAGESKTLASQRAQNAMTYLTKSKGIDARRIQTKTSPEPQRVVDVWSIPAGATMPAAATPDKQ
jgi:outer membrane protein OmpA-like peptidoglycan-associated protein